jgi:hypothetical protein
MVSTLQVIGQQEHQYQDHPRERQNQNYQQARHIRLSHLVACAVCTTDHPVVIPGTNAPINGIFFSRIPQFWS